MRRSHKMSDATETSTTVKVVLVGDSGTGKSSIALQYAEKRFEEHKAFTLGVDFKRVEARVDGTLYKVQIWDTAGQERFRSLAPSYVRDAWIVFVVYDQTRAETFEAVDYWAGMVRHERGMEVVMVLVGNKADLPGAQVSYQELEDKAAELDCFFMQTSAANYPMVARVFDLALRNLPATLPIQIVRRTALGSDDDNEEDMSSSSTKRPVCCRS